MLFSFLESFSHQRKPKVFHWSLRDNKSSQVSRTLLSILSDLNNVIVWIIPTRPLISKSSSPFNKSLLTVPRALIKIGITVTFMFYSFFNSLARSEYLSFFSFSFSFTLWSPGTAKSTIRQVLFFFLLIIIFIIIIIIWLLARFSRQRLLVGFHWNMMKASLLRSPGFFGVFWPNSIMLKSRWSRFFLRFPTLPIPFPIFQGPFQVHQLLLVSLLLACSTVFCFFV